MKIVLFGIVSCIVLGVVYSCTSRDECDLTSCSFGREMHCVDGACKCTTSSGLTCFDDDDDCKSYSNGDEHCGHHGGDWEWKCIHSECRCVHD